MTTLWAEQALLATRWARNMAVTIIGDRISAITPNAAPQGTRLGLLLPPPTNLHSHALWRA
jgi:formimidoylglutamate deiminase